MSTLQRFSLVFAVALILQTFIWQHTTVVDQDLWIPRITSFVPTTLTAADITNTVYSNTPGTVGLLLAQAITATDISPEKSLYLSISLLVSFAAAACACLTYIIYPRTWWWLPVGIIVAAHPLYLQSTPVDAVGAPLLALCALLFLWYDHAPRATSLSSDIFFAFIIGAAGATRMHMAIIMIVPALILLQKVIGWRRLTLITGSALAFTIALNPLLGFVPLAYLQIGAIHGTIGFSARHSMNQVSIANSLGNFSFASFALISIALGTLYAFTKSRLPLHSPVSSQFIVSLMVITVTTTAVLFLASIQISRYFFPLVLIWEILLPLFLFHLISQSPRLHAFPKQKRLLIASASALLLTAVPTVSLLLYTISLPSALPPSL